ncbi:MAG: hypothetical protein ABI376_06245 [Caulobacteraceae bacterium]
MTAVDPPPFDPRLIVFLDIEASGLGEDSFPIEVGWAFLAGPSGGMLIRPAADWDMDAWDPMAEALHHISRGDLMRDGHAPRDVAEHLNRLLAPPLRVFSDAPDQDSFWLRRLFEETPEVQEFRLEDDGMARGQWFGEAPPARNRASDVRHLHRAEADALVIVTAWRTHLASKRR